MVGGDCPVEMPGVGRPVLAFVSVPRPGLLDVAGSRFKAVASGINPASSGILP